MHLRSPSSAMCAKEVRLCNEEVQMCTMEIQNEYFTSALVLLIAFYF